MRSGPIKCLVCTVQYWQSLAGCMPWECYSLWEFLQWNKGRGKQPQSAYPHFFNCSELLYSYCVLSCPKQQGFSGKRNCAKVAHTWVTHHANNDFLKPTYSKRMSLQRDGIFVPFLLELQSFGTRFMPLSKMCTNPGLQEILSAFLPLPPHLSMHTNTPDFSKAEQKTQHLPATLTFSEFAALGVAVLVPLVRLPPVPL